MDVQMRPYHIIKEISRECSDLVMNDAFRFPHWSRWRRDNRSRVWVRYHMDPNATEFGSMREFWRYVRANRLQAAYAPVLRLSEWGLPTSHVIWLC